MVLLTTITHSQDIITKTNGEEIKSKVLEVTQTDIKYKRFDQLDGPTFTISKTELFMIKYQNGSKDIFTESDKKKLSPSNDDDMIQKGKEDAITYYKGRNSGAGWTAATSVLLSPLFGLIPAAICTSSEPAVENLNAPKAELMKNSAYTKGYTEQAHKTKKRKIWSSYGIGSGAWVLILLLL